MNQARADSSSRDSKPASFAHQLHRFSHNGKSLPEKVGMGGGREEREEEEEPLGAPGSKGRREETTFRISVSKGRTSRIDLAEVEATVGGWITLGLEVTMRSSAKHRESESILSSRIRMSAIEGTP